MADHPERDFLLREARFLGLTGLMWMDESLLREKIEEAKMKKGEEVKQEIVFKTRKK